MLLRRISVAFLLVAVACDGASDESGDPCSAYVDAFLDYATRCGDGGDGLTDARTELRAACQKSLALNGQSGLAEALTTCASKVQGVSCKDLTALDCDTPKGTLADGTACAEGFQCASGFCKKAKNTTNGSEASCGTCAATLGEGAECDSDGECSEGLDCVFGAKRTCAKPARAAAGSKCQPFQRDACAEGLVCNRTGTAGETTCQAPAKAGAGCYDDYACEGDLVCSDDDDTCVAAAAEGASCATTDCKSGLACDPSSKTCKKPVYVAIGASCDHTVTYCETGFCKGYDKAVESETGAVTITPGTCAAYLDDGAACDDKADGNDVDKCRSKCVNGTCTTEDPSVCK